MTKYFDICVNIASDRFADDASLVISEAQSCGVQYIALTGSSLASTQKAITMAKQHPPCIATCGIHPHDASSFSTAAARSLKTLSSASVVKAIGECGLDYNRMYSPVEDQHKCFDWHIELAQETKLPLFLHERDAHVDFLKALEKYDGPAVVHCFTGGPDQALAYLNRGFYIGITGWVCDERRNQELLKALSVIPLSRLMIETDAPWLTPRTIRPRPKKNRNTPSNLPHIANFIAERMQISPTLIAEKTTQNALSFFGLN